MAAGLATLDLIAVPGFYERVGAACSRLVDGLNSAGRDAGVSYCAQSIGTMAGMYMLASPPAGFAQVQAQDVERFKRFYHLMLDAGVYFPPSPVEAFFFSSAISDEDIELTLASARTALRALA